MGYNMGDQAPKFSFYFLQHGALYSALGLNAKKIILFH